MNIKNIRQILYLLCYKRMSIPSYEIETINVDLNNVSWFCQSTNSILRVSFNGKLYYFRECLPVCDKVSFIQKSIDEFIFLIKNVPLSTFKINDKSTLSLSYTRDIIDAFDEYLDLKRKEINFIKMLSQIDSIYADNNYSIWNDTIFDKTLYDSMGFTDVSQNLEDIMSLFLWFMRGKIQAYFFNSISNDGQYSCFYSSKALASKIVAEELKNSSLIVSSFYCRLRISDYEIFGLMSEEAPGKRMKDVRLENYQYVQRQLNNLNILDYIVMQKDHGPNNYNVYDNGTKSSICAFDNDNSFTFFPVISSKYSLSGSSPIIDSNGFYNRPYVDELLLRSLENVNYRELIHSLKVHLNYIQVISLLWRIANIRKAIYKSMSKGNTKKLNDVEWNMNTTLIELKKAEKNKTYLSISVM